MERRGFFADVAARYIRLALLLFCALCLLCPARPAGAGPLPARDSEAVLLVRQGQPLYWYPREIDDIVFLVNRGLCQEEISDWQDLYRSRAVIGIEDGDADWKSGILALTLALRGSCREQDVLSLLTELWQDGRLVVHYRGREYSRDHSAVAPAPFPVEILFRSEAERRRQLQDRNHLVLVTPRTHPLHVTRGLLSDRPLAGGNARPPQTDLEDPETFEATCLALPALLRRHVARYRVWARNGRTSLIAAYLVTFAAIFLVFGFLQHHTQRRNVLLAARLAEGSLVLLALVRFFKLYTDETSPLNRFLWYAFYPPYFLIALSLLLAIYYMTRQHGDFRVPSWWKGLAALDGAVCLVILTNDLTEAFAAFPLGPTLGSNVYEITLEGSLIKCFLAAQFCAAFLLLVRNSCAMVRHPRKRPDGTGERADAGAVLQWKYALPALILSLELAYHFCYGMNLASARHWDTCLVLIWGCLAFAAVSDYLYLLPVNRGYERAFDCATVSMAICDAAGHTVYGILPRPHPPESGLVLHRLPLDRGSFWWQEDLSEIRRLRHSLDLSNRTLSRYVRLLRRRREIRSRYLTLQQQNRLFAELAAICESKSHAVRVLTGQLERRDLDRTGQKRIMRLVSCLIVYLKKRCVLLLSSKGQGTVKPLEFMMALRESCDSFTAAGLQSACTYRLDRPLLAAGDALVLYDLAEFLLESCSRLPGETVLLSLVETGGALRLVCLASPGLAGILAAAGRTIARRKEWASCRTEFDEDDSATLYVTLKPEEERRPAP